MGPSLVIAGTHSGVGKTTITLGLIAALCRRGLRVQPFKCGPDYIDPTYHALAAGRPCRNLDTWMVPPERLAELFARAAPDADVAIIEGVMGLFDGLGYDNETGSTAQVAKLLEAPVVLVLDVAKQARSAAALAFGFLQFDDQVNLAGFILNRVGSDNHGRGTARAVEQATGLPVFGWLPRTDKLQVPERHLGLIPTVEPGLWDELIHAAAENVETFLDVDRLLNVACPPLPPYSEGEGPGVRGLHHPSPQVRYTQPAPAKPAGSQYLTCGLGGDGAVIAVARDEAFHFIYEENLELLRAAGASLAFFSPLRDAELPAGTRGIILSGGFPEMFVRELSANRSLLDAIRQAHRRNLPIYAECGGLMYLTESITDLQDQQYAMAGILPGFSVMTNKLTLGYRQARAGGSSWLFREGDVVRGHEFHYSTWENRPANLPPAYLVTSPTRDQNEARPEGARLGCLHASYVHVHFWNKPELASRFVAACCGLAKIGS